jgi:hypothetical protein
MEEHDMRSASRSRSGIALVTGLALVAVVSVLVLGTIITTQVELFVTRNDATSAQAQYVAQAGLQSYKAGLFQNYRWLETLGDSGGGAVGGYCLNSLASGFDVGRDGTVLPWISNRITLPQGQVHSVAGDVIGTFNVRLIRDPSNFSRITIESIGRTVAGPQNVQATSTARGTFVIQNSTVLNQAIFAGAGSGMRFVNGNTAVYGGVYIVGNRANPDELVFESNGNMSMFNAYDRRSDTTTLGRFLVSDALKVDNLCATLRVESGRIAVGGSTQIGTPEKPLLTVAVGRGLSDIDVTRGGTTQCEENKGVCTESPVGPFDIADNPPDFPQLDWEPRTELCPSGKTWRTCIRDEATSDGLIITNVSGTASIVSPANLSLPTACMSLLNGAASAASRDLVLDGTAIDCTATTSDGRTVGFKYSVTTTPALFEIFGNLNLRGLNLNFNRSVEYRALSRNGGTVDPFASISVEEVATLGGGNIRIADSFVTASTTKFPNNVISLVAEKNVHLRGGNNTYVTAPIYAGDQFRIRGQTQLFGQVFANEFCTTNVLSECSTAGTPAEVYYVETGLNRPRSFRAIARNAGIPTFRAEVFEIR